MEFVTKWRLDNRDLPEKVEVFEVGNYYCIVKCGDTIEEHTAYKGNFYNSPADAYIAAFADCERSIRYATEKKQRLERAKERFLRSESE
jgi:hypothetical protein